MSAWLHALQATTVTLLLIVVAAVATIGIIDFIIKRED